MPRMPCFMSFAGAGCSWRWAAGGRAAWAVTARALVLLPLAHDGRAGVPGISVGCSAAGGRVPGNSPRAWGVWLHKARDEPWWLAIGLVRWLVFRLMFLSGVVKLASGDVAGEPGRPWRITTRPSHCRPGQAGTFISFPQASTGCRSGSCSMPNLSLRSSCSAPGRCGGVGFVSLVLLQTLIAATGNYGFFKSSRPSFACRCWTIGTGTG